jgi:NADPH2:quinone reductase
MRRRPQSANSNKGVSMSVFKAFRIHAGADGTRAGFENLSIDQLTAGEVVIRVEYSGINYKDALAATGAGKILRSSPLVGGVDLAGKVVSSTDARYAPGDAVLVTGCGLSETLDGGYAEFARVPAESVVPMPPGLDARKAMIVGTAGFAAALSIHKMEQNGLQPGGLPVLVTGASGGVGSLAIDMLTARGYSAVAVSGKAAADDYLTALGAAKIMRSGEFDLGKRPLERALWAGAIDNVGGEVLAWLTRTVDFNGSIASVGLAGGADLKTTVMPFILRGINILGVNSAATVRDKRLALWQRIATDLKPRHFERIVTREIAFADLPGAFDDYLKSRIIGRTLIRIGA